MIRILIAGICIAISASAQTNSRVPIRFLALGDSYTIGESVPENERWPEQLATALRAKGLKVETRIIAVTGWRTDQLMKAIVDAKLDPSYNLVSLLIGVNNQYQGKPVENYPAEFEQLLSKAIELAGGKKESVFVVSIPDYGYTPFGKTKQTEISKGIDQYNAVNRKVAQQAGVMYIEITDLTRQGLANPDYVASDGLHPSGKMYSLWVKRMLGLLPL